MHYLKTFAHLCALTLLTMGLVANATAQVPKIDQLPDGAAPLPAVNGARWLQQALLTPLLKRPPAPAQAAPEQTAPEVKELTGVHEKIGSALKGTIFEKVGDPADAAQQQRIWAEMAKRWRAEEATTTQRVSDETSPAASSMPVFDPYQYPPANDPTAAAIEQLRNSARNLDQAAADLEDAGKYTAADRLRAKAKRLRREAREFAAEPETPAEQPATHEAAITR